LKAADESNAVRHQRYDDERAQHVSDEERYAQAHFEGERHDRGFDGEEQEREGRVDERCDRRSEIAKPGAAREQVDVDAVGCGVIRNRQAGEQDQDADDENRGSAVDEAVIDRDRSADRLQGEEGNRPDRGVGDAQARPASRGFGGEAKRVIFEGLIGDPLVVITPNANDALLRCHEKSPCRPSYC
jgi:hypothetical protein